MSERDAYGTPKMDDIDAILAEFHREERSESAPARPRRQPETRETAAPAAAPRPMTRAQRREAEEQRARQTQLFETRTGDTPTVQMQLPRTENAAPAPRRTAEEQPTKARRLAEEPAAKPRLEPEEEIARETRRLTGGDRTGAQQRKTRDREEQARREAQAAKRRRRGRISIVCALLALALALGGLLYWEIRTERENAPEEPAPLALDLGEQLEDYLYDSSIKSHG